MVDLTCSGLINERTPGINAVVDPVFGPVGRRGEAFLRKLRKAKALLLLKTTGNKNIHVRLHDGVTRVWRCRMLRHADINPDLRTGVRNKLVCQRPDVRGLDTSSAIGHFALIRCSELRLVDLIDHGVQMACLVRPDSQIGRAKTNRCPPRELAAPVSLDVDRISRAGLR